MIAAPVNTAVLATEATKQVTTAKRRYLVIANPQSRSGLAANAIETLRCSLRQQGLHAQFVNCSELAHAQFLSRQANRDQLDVIVAVGGDGTINAVLNGFYNPDGTLLSGTVLGVVHVGTSPDFCRSYGVPLGIQAAAKTLQHGVIRRVQLGHMSYCSRPDAPQTTTAVFACCANLGLGAAVAQYANAGLRRRFGDVGGTFLAVLRAVRSNRPFDLELEIDGTTERWDRVSNVAIGRTLHVASGLKIRSALDPNRPGFYVLIVRQLSLRNLWLLVFRLYSGRPIPNSRTTRLLYGTRIRVTPLHTSAPVEFDGDPVGWSPCTVTPTRDPLPLLVPPSEGL